MNQNKQTQITSVVEFKRLLEQCRAGDFDGHVDFKKLSFSRRLDALASLAAFTIEFRGLLGNTDKKTSATPV